MRLGITYKEWTFTFRGSAEQGRQFFDRFQIVATRALESWERVEAQKTRRQELKSK